MKRSVYRITLAEGNRWILTGGAIPRVIRLQRTAIAKGVQVCRFIAKRGGLSQLVLHGRNGRIRWERTYPRKSDPRRTKG